MEISCTKIIDTVLKIGVKICIGQLTATTFFMK